MGEDPGAGRGQNEVVGEGPPLRAAHEHQRRALFRLREYEGDMNPAADVFAITAGTAALESALPSTIRVVGGGYVGTPYDHTELATAVSGDGLATFFQNVQV